MSSNVQAVLRLPPLYEAQKIFGNWDTVHPQAQVLVAPSGTKVGKSFGSSTWLTKRAALCPNTYNAWIGPTYLKAKIGYRYMKAMLGGLPGVHCTDGKLEMQLANGAFVKFLHGKDAETTVEGEAIDNFVIDESGKQDKQLWYSLLTTLTQTKGKGIVTGTPRGLTWYNDIFKKAKKGDPFYCWTHLATRMSPYVTPEAIANAKRILPKALFDQYYEALFVSGGGVFGDLSHIWDESLTVKSGVKFWIHPDAETRKLDTYTGWDIAKHRDYSVFYTVNEQGKLVGYARFRQVPYEQQVDRLKNYLHKYFKGDRSLRYDATGVGEAVGEMIVDKDIDASVTAVTFTNKSKQEMISRSTVAIESGWHKAPRIDDMESEFGNYELKVTKSGLFTYAAADGHDDIVSAAMLAISGAYQSSLADEAEKVYEDAMNGRLAAIDPDDDDGEDDDDLDAYTDDGFLEDDDDFDGDDDDVYDDLND